MVKKAGTQRYTYIGNNYQYCIPTKFVLESAYMQNLWYILRKHQHHQIKIQKGYNRFPVPSGNIVKNFCPFS